MLFVAALEGRVREAGREAGKRRQQPDTVPGATWQSNPWAVERTGVLDTAQWGLNNSRAGAEVAKETAMGQTG